MSINVVERRIFCKFDQNMIEHDPYSWLNLPLKSFKIHKKGHTKHIIEGLQHRHEGGFHHSNVPPAVVFRGCWDAEDLMNFSGRYQKHLEEYEENKLC
jgi:hypothetical protein